MSPVRRNWPTSSDAGHGRGMLAPAPGRDEAQGAASHAWTSGSDDAQRGGDETMDATLLLIEDEAAIADTLVYALEAEGFRVLWRRLGRDGLASLESEAVHLVVLDIGLPDDNGFELCRRIRARWQLPVIFLTARKEEVDRIVGLEIGADDYVTKPFSPRELAARAKAVLRRTHARAEEAVPDAASAPTPFVIDDERKRIRYHGEWLDLTTYEYRILRVLASRPEQVFSREHLLEQVWDEPEQSLDRAVDTHIKTLRAKLRGIAPESNPIRTHRGLGYSVTPE